MKIEGGAPSISDPAVIAASLRCGGAGLLDLVQVRRRILGEVLAGTASPDTTQEVLEAACGYLSEVLSTFDMAHRAIHDPTAESPVAG